MRSRGIGLGTARNLLTHAFAGDITGRIKLEAVRAELERSLFTRLPQNQKDVESI
jgi:hypothetical protein